MRYSLLVPLLAVLTTTLTAAESWDVDLRPMFEKFGLRPQSQGRRGTCSVFAVTGVCEFEWSRFTGKATRLSVEYLNWARHRACPARSDGGCFQHIIAGLHRYGVCEFALMPYQQDYVPELPPPIDRIRYSVYTTYIDVNAPPTDEEIVSSNVATAEVSLTR